MEIEIEKVLPEITTWVVEIIDSGSVKESSAVMRGFDGYTASVDHASLPPIPGCITIKVVADVDSEEVRLFFMPNGFYVGSSRDRYVYMDLFTEETLVANMRKHYRYYRSVRNDDGSISTTFSEGAGIFEGCWLPDITVSQLNGKVVLAAVV